MGCGVDVDGVLLARLTGIAHRYTRSGEGPVQANAVVELAKAAKERGDLLAQIAGLEFGAAWITDLDLPWKIATSQLCIAAGADLQQIEKWVEIGRQKRVNPASFRLLQP